MRRPAQPGVHPCNGTSATGHSRAAGVLWDAADVVDTHSEPSIWRPLIAWAQRTRMGGGVSFGVCGRRRWGYMRCCCAGAGGVVGGCSASGSPRREVSCQRSITAVTQRMGT